MMARLSLNTENSSNVILVTAIILIISSLFMPLVFVYIIQDYLYLSVDKWFYDTPSSAYVIFMIGMLWIAVTLLLYLFFTWKFEWKGIKWISLLVMLGCVPFFMFGVSNYYYLDDQGMHFNDYKTFNTINSYYWEDVKEAKEIFVKNNGVTVVDHLNLVTEAGEVIELPYNSKVQNNRFKIMEKLEENNIPLTNNMGDLYE
ncbi:hypothetical protein LC048_12095 [Mesobacillus subterraneus]|uniref:hypothetical protein n=1 Tax=Mesobacillus subterraneus TaxID=285983 RepID=UPI00273FAA1B|nr:hypothetical protein [Mesobacillus subterraneus]WLR57526.1 hypothetical protein LC048_12095 [Mesobacillus subterraneus]